MASRWSLRVDFAGAGEPELLGSLRATRGRSLGYTRWIDLSSTANDVVASSSASAELSPCILPAVAEPSEGECSGGAERWIRRV